MADDLQEHRTDPDLPTMRAPACCPPWPAPPPARTPWEETANRYLSRWEGLAGGYGLVLLIAAAAVAAWPLPERLELLPWGVLLLAVGVGCAVRFLRCRTAHCAVTATLAPLGLLMLVDVAVGGDWLGDAAGLVALGILVVGFGFEAVWAATHGGRSEVRVERPSQVRPGADGSGS